MLKRLDEFILVEDDQLNEKDEKALEIKGFYRETEFKDTEIGRIPKDRVISKLMDVGEIVNGFGFPIDRVSR